MQNRDQHVDKSSKNQGKKTVIIAKQAIKSIGKNTYSKGSGYKSLSNNFKKNSNYKTNFKANNSQLGISDFEKRKLAEQRATKNYISDDDSDKKSKVGTKKRDV